jgi:hypothetical protein
MKGAPCVVSVADHTGWAHLVCVAASGNVPTVIVRRRVALIDRGLPTLPYEHDTAAMREDEANAVIARVRKSIAARTSDVLRRVVIELAPAHTAVALAIRESPFVDLPKTVAAVRSSYRLLCAADGMLYRLALCHEARELGLEVQEYRRGDETTRAARGLSVTPGEVDQFVTGRGRPAGPPWTREHRRAYAAGIAALAPHTRERLRLPA